MKALIRGPFPDWRIYEEDRIGGTDTPDPSSHGVRATETSVNQTDGVAVQGIDVVNYFVAQEPARDWKSFLRTSGATVTSLKTKRT
jgi:hypothetical protein